MYKYYIINKLIILKHELKKIVFDVKYTDFTPNLTWV